MILALEESNMKLSEINKIGKESTKVASDIVRQLSLAGVGIIWLFKSSDDSDILFSPILVFPLLFLALALFCDLIQYIIAGNIWRNFVKDSQALKTPSNQDPDVDIPDAKSKPIYFFYYSKIVLMFCAYIIIITHLVKVLFPCDCN